MAVHVKTQAIRFLDMLDRVSEIHKSVDAEIERLVDAAAREASPEKREAIERKLEQLREQKAKLDPFDPLFAAVRADLNSGAAMRMRFGVFPTQSKKPPGELREVEKQIAAVYGILVRDNDVKPELRSFGRALSLARAEYNANSTLYDKILDILVDIGDEHGEAHIGQQVVPTDDVRESDWVAVAQALANRGVAPDELYLDVMVRVELNARKGRDGEAPPSSQEIELPDLEAEVDVEIVEANLHAMQAMYFAAMLEEVKLFQVADKLVELFHQGVLPLGRGRAGDLLFRYWKKSNDRFTEVERNNLYGRAFGLPGGDPALGSTNREFNNSWLRFISAVSSYNRQVTVDDLLRSRIPASVSQEQVRKAGRDLAATLSLYGYGVAYFAATELQQQIVDILEILREEEVQKAYGARDPWQVVDQVAALELGGIRMSTTRGRTMAQAGAIIIRWLATKHNDLASVGRGQLLDESAIRSQNAQRSSSPMQNPNDVDLVIAAEQWLAVTGTPDMQIEEFSQPSETPAQTSRPVQIPQAARDLLESVGVGVPMSMGGGNGYGPQRGG